MNRDLFRRHFACPSCSTSCPGDHDNDCSCCGTHRGFGGLLICFLSGGFAGTGIGYFFSILLVPVFVAWRYAGIKAVASIPWYAKAVLPTIVFPGIPLSTILYICLTFGLIGGLLLGFLLGLIYIFLIRHVRCERCSRPLTGSAVVTYCKTCRRNFCFDCCYRSRQLNTEYRYHVFDET